MESQLYRDFVTRVCLAIIISRSVGEVRVAAKCFNCPFLLLFYYYYYYYYCERFEQRSHFKSRLSLIVRVNVVLNRTVVVDSD